MNIVLYAGDRKYHSVLEPIANELKNTDNGFLYYFLNVLKMKLLLKLDLDLRNNNIK